MSAVLEESHDIDTEQMSTDLANDLGLGLDTSNRDPANDTLDAADPAAETGTVTRDPASGKFAKGADPAADPAAADPAAVVEDLPVPKSWAKEMHPIWDKLAKGQPLLPDEAKRAAKYYNERETQMAEGAKVYASDAEYGRSLRGVIGRHEDVLRAQGLDAPKAVEFLFNAHRNLSTGTEEQKQAYLARVAQSYGIRMPGAAQADPNDPNAQAAVETPAMKELRERQERIEASINAENQRRYEETRAATAKEVEAFASDPKNPYFEECADHICMLLKADPKMPLGDAYATAVWANPVTRQKELARIQQERETEDRKRTEAAVRAAKKGTSANVKGRDTARAPTAPAASLANLDDVMRETHEEIKSRVD